MNLLAVNYTHDASVCLLADGGVVFYSKEERFSRRKRDGVPYRSLLAMRERGLLDGLDEFVVCNWRSFGEAPVYTDYYRRLCGRLAPASRFSVVAGQHHLFHAWNAFHASGFNAAVVVVADSGGAVVDADGAIEKESVYLFQNGECRLLFRHLSSDRQTAGGTRRYGICDRYDRATRTLGLDILEAGKTMGLSAFGRPGAANGHLPPIPAAITRDNYLPYADLALAAQRATAAEALALIRTWVERTGVRKVCVTGGYGMNGVANFHYVEELGGNVEVFADPLADDGGITLGMAWSLGGAARQPFDGLFFSGFRYDSGALGGEAAGPEEVAARLADGQVGALFHGHAEAGARALGHRSILFDPRRPDGADRVNRVKRREWYRPFAATVLAEHAREWFDLGHLAASPWMTFVLPVRPEAAATVPAVTHVDGTCRIQTLRREQCPELYDLIAAFHRATGVPMLLNTSFNLAGEPLVETPEDALRVLAGSALDFVYFPATGTLRSA